MDSTIAAISSPPGPGLRGVIRISGPAAQSVVASVLAGEAELESRTAFSARFHDGGGEQPCLVLWMPGPASYTREDVAEFHLPGAPPLLKAALERLLEAGCVAAAPGEFTRRAFLNGRLDLTQAEGVLELVEATNDAERRAALALVEGGLASRIDELRDGLEDLRALTEASLDFDETDTGHVPLDELQRRVAEIEHSLEQALAWEVRRQGPSALPRIALVGAPNAGKSALFNALVPEGRALVSDVRGSTRDGASGLWCVLGVDCLLLDAPGVDDAASGADQTAQKLAAHERATADLWLLVESSEGGGRLSPGEEMIETEPLGEPRPQGLVVWSQIDRADAAVAPGGAVPVSALERRGLQELEAAVSSLLGFGDSPGGEGDVGRAGDRAAGGSLTRELSARHRQSLLDATEAVRRGRGMLEQAAPLDLVAEALRVATDSLDGIGGRTTPEDLLDRIFARFCLGK